MNARILHVEDYPSNRMMVRDLLQFHGYQVVDVLDGEAAIAATDRERPDLILMDIRLPGISGFEAARRIKQREDLRGIPIIAITSYPTDGDVEEAAAAGCAAYVARPCKPQVLVGLVRHSLTIR